MSDDSPPTPDTPTSAEEHEAEALLAAGLSGGTGGGKAPPPPPEAVAARFPDFEVIEILGHGGMGVVYKARQRKLDRLVALKVLPQELSADPAFAARFAREARTLARLQHPHIVGVHDFGEADGQAFLVMEYVDGVTLRQLMATGELTPREALAIVPQICDALQYAHDEGVVHRDIKPENVLLDRAGRVKVADFGLAKLVQRGPADFTITGTDQVMGTLHYMAPEQYRTPQDVDHRADIFSLGVVFYEMLTGDLPVGRFEKPSTAQGLDDRIDAIVMRALERERDQRYQKVHDVRSDVDTYVGGQAADAPAVDRPPETGASRVREHTRAWRARGGEGGRRMSRWAQIAFFALPVTAVLALVTYLVIDGVGDPEHGRAWRGFAAWLTALCGAGCALLLSITAVVVTRVCRETVRGQGLAILALVLSIGGMTAGLSGMAQEVRAIGRLTRARDDARSRRMLDLASARVQVAGTRLDTESKRELLLDVGRTWDAYVETVRVRDPEVASVTGRRLYDEADLRTLSAMDEDIFLRKLDDNQLGMGLIGSRSLRRPPYEYRLWRIEVDDWQRTAKVTVTSHPAGLSRITFPMKRSGNGWVFALGPVEIHEK